MSTHLPLTPSQTVGPFFAHCLPWADGPYVVTADTAGAFWLRGRIIDENGDPVPDALVESWQADPEGRFAHPDDPRGAGVEFRGFGRCPTDAHGQWGILTVRPGRVPDPAGRPQAPHINLSIFARGLLDRLFTRAYLPGHRPDGPLSSLVATEDPQGYRFDIVLQGDGETVFLDHPRTQD